MVTPRTDNAEKFSAVDYKANASIACVRADFARELERELIAAHQKIAEMEEDNYNRMVERNMRDSE